MNEFLSRHARSVLLPDRQCTGTNRDGERCGRASAVGQLVCDRHGGKSPLAIKAANDFLAYLREPALEALHRAVRSAPPCETCGRSDADRDPTTVRAAIAILDRAGLGPHASIDVNPTATNDLAHLTLAELADRAERNAQRIRLMADAEARKAGPQQEVIDVEVSHDAG